MTSSAIVAALRAKFSFTSERELQDAIATVLDRASCSYEREVDISAGDRIDFLCGSIGIEVKCGGSLANLTRQLHRYAQSTAISELIVVVGLRRLEDIPMLLCGKTIKVVSLWRCSL